MISALITAVFAALAFRLSFAALTALAVKHGVQADEAWMFAALVDGGAVVGTAGVVAARWSGRRTWPYWLTVGGFASLSLGFNIAHSDGTSAGIAIAITPPAAQLVATELLVRLLPTPAPATVPLVHAPQHAAEASAPERLASAATEDDGTADPPTQTRPAVDLAALIAENPAPAAHDLLANRAVASPEQQPLAATFAAPPAVAELAPEDLGDAEVAAPAVPQEAVAAYRRIQQETQQRPTAEEFGAALNLRRSRGGELRQLVEAHLGLDTPCLVTVP